MRLTKELEERRHRADEERKKLEMERVAAELEQKRALEKAHLEKEEKERMVSLFHFVKNVDGHIEKKSNFNSLA